MEEVSISFEPINNTNGDHEDSCHSEEGERPTDCFITSSIGRVQHVTGDASQTMSGVITTSLARGFAVGTNRCFGFLVFIHSIRTFFITFLVVEVLIIRRCVTTEALIRIGSVTGPTRVDTEEINV
jgi:hypothetical protein